MEISNGDFGASRDGLEAKLVILEEETQRLSVPAASWRPSGLLAHREAAASAGETETKCGSGLVQRCPGAAGDAREMKTREMERSMGAA